MASSRNISTGTMTTPKRSSHFIDGPITANNPMGVHHAWGRTYKDLFQRYQAMLGNKQRYQNGFDCQGLWVEVEVEKELGLKSKRDIETYGVAEFVERCKERVRKFADAADRPIHPPRLLDGLGQLLLHDVRREQLHDLALPEDLPRARLDLQGPRRHALVPALRHRHLRARDRYRGLPGPDPPLGLRPLPAARRRERLRCWSGRRRPGRWPPTSPRPSIRSSTTRGSSRTTRCLLPRQGGR